MSNENRNILARIRRFLAAPIFEGNEDKTRAASLLNVISLTFLSLGIASVLILFNPRTLVMGTVFTLTALSVQFPMRRGRVRLASLIQVSLLWVLITYLAINGGGVRAAIFGGFGMVTLMAGLLLGGYSGFAVAGLSIVAGLGMLYAEGSGYLTFTGSTSESALVTQAALIGFVAVMAYLATHGIQDALERARRNERALMESNRELQAIRVSLEQRNEHLHTTVQRYDDHMAEVGRGNLASRLHLDGDGHEVDDPLVMLGRRLNETTASLHGMISRIHEAAGSLSALGAEILAATTQQASGANEQSAAVAQTTTTVDELKTIAEQSAARAQEVAGVSQRTVEVSRTGQRAVADTVGSMREIRSRVEGIAENILALSEQTQQVGEIIDTVNEIATQSNILALNASVEAARAGEYGKGFAVVAVEVRNLAEQSKQATAQVRAILSDIQKATNATVMATEEGTKQVEEGMVLAAQAGESIEQLAGVIEESAQAATQMVAGGRQQATGVEQVAVAMQSINQATVQSLASTRQAEKAAQELNGLARQLTDIVGQYQVSS
jgi:methyl-accepting chemotaxis protein